MVKASTAALLGLKSSLEPNSDRVGVEQGTDQALALLASPTIGRSLSEGSVLRRAQTLADTIDSATQEPVALEVERPAAKAERVVEGVWPEVDRRVSKTERRTLDALRAEVQRTLVPDKDRRSQRVTRTRSFSIKPSRVVLLLIAILAGGLAAFFATQREPAAPPPIVQPATEPQRAASVQILVAKQTIGVGQRLAAASLAWQDWPVSAMRPEYITITGAPGAMADMASSVARVQLFAGEPIRAEKLAPAGSGYLSAILGKGMRAGSVAVTPETASGGFIVPNDRVDVLLTRSTGGGQDAQIILHNIRVLAINAHVGQVAPSTTPAATGDPGGDAFTGQAIATLELDPTQAEVLTDATTVGKLSLVLRASADSADPVDVAQQQDRTINAAIRLTSPFWATGTGTTAPSVH